MELAVGYFHRHRLDIGLVGPARLRPDVEVFELVPLHIEGKDALSRSGNSLVGFRKVEFGDIFAFGDLLRKSCHSPMFAYKQVGILGAGHPRSNTTGAFTGTVGRI